MNDEAKEPVPTMIYAPNGDNGGVLSLHPIIAEGGKPTDQYYWHKVVDAEDVEDHLKNGWFKSPQALPKKRGPKAKE
jgi:hypothetical protein